MVDVVIKDASGETAKVTDDGHLETESIVVSSIEHISDETGRAFAWSSTFALSAGDQEWLSIQNDATDLLLHIDFMYVGSIILAVSTANLRTSGTAAGTTVTGVALNDDRGKTAEATAFGDNEVTGVLVGDIIMHLQTPADETKKFDFQGAVILGKNDVFFLSGVTQTTYFGTVFGHFDET